MVIKVKMSSSMTTTPPIPSLSHAPQTQEVITSEGVIQFEASHDQRPLAPRTYSRIASSINAWRALFFELGVIGRDPHRYEGAGYGNLSARLTPISAPQGDRPFLITGTQTGGARDLTLSQYCVVRRYEITSNRVDSFGSIYPSSESMTHGALYDLSPRLRFVFHIHAPDIWRYARELRLPTTSAHVGYGTAEMALAVQRLWRAGHFELGGVLAMGGHEDGVISCGASAEDAGEALIREWVRAKKIDLEKQKNQTL
jgi:L-ribulose-5-phosphate 4-epimerase